MRGDQPFGGIAMNQAEFEADLRRAGYQVFYGGNKAGEASADHAHDYAVRLMVIGGEFTVIRGGRADTFRAGDQCTVAAGEVHAERTGPQGVALVIGRRTA